MKTPNDINPTILQIKNDIKLLGLSQKELAEKCGVPLPTLRSLFSGQRNNPTDSTLCKIKSAVYPDGVERVLSDNELRVDKRIKEMFNKFDLDLLTDEELNDIVTVAEITAKNIIKRKQK